MVAPDHRRIYSGGLEVPEDPGGFLEEVWRGQHAGEMA